MAHLSFLAGKTALARLKDEGLRQDQFKVVAGASGAAKWLVLSQLDRYMFSEFFKPRTTPLHLLGSSIGSWRFAGASQADPSAAIGRLEHGYIEQRYTGRPTMAEVTKTSLAILEDFLPSDKIKEIIDHPTHRLSFIALRSRGPMASDKKLPLGLALGGAALTNIMSARSLNLFFERTLFFDPRSPPPYLNVPSYRSSAVPLTLDNVGPGLLASGSIPLVMQGVKDIAGAKPGVYRDGGIMDYHLDIPFLPANERDLVLFPHFEERLIPGWFDKKLAWRRHDPKHLANVLLVAPSPAFIRSLPLQKIPDRNDFYTFEGRDDERIKYWRTVVKACERLVDEFHEVVQGNRIVDRVQPF